MIRNLGVFERVESKRVKHRESENRRFMHDSVQLLKKRQFKARSECDRLCLRGRGRVVLAVVRLRSQMRLVGSVSRSFREQSSRFVHLSLNCGGGADKKVVAENRCRQRKKTEVIFKRKRQAFYSSFDREIQDVLKSVLGKKKKEILLSLYSRNRCPL